MGELLRDAPAEAEWKPEGWQVCVCSGVCVCACMYACVCMCPCVRACVCCGLGGKPDVCCSGGQAASHPPAVRAPPTIQPQDCPTGPQSLSRSRASDLVTHSFNNGLRTWSVFNIILEPEDTPMNRKEKTRKK